MIELAVAATVAALLNNSVSAVDKIYNWTRALKKQRPASLELRNNPELGVLHYVTVGQENGPVRVVMTYQQLAAKLTPEDVRHIEGFAQRMEIAMTRWDKLNASLPLFDEVERGRVEANMELMKHRDICPSLNAVVSFIERMGIDLEDHYASARSIC